MSEEVSEISEALFTELNREYNSVKLYIRKQRFETVTDPGPLTTIEEAKSLVETILQTIQKSIDAIDAENQYYYRLLGMRSAIICEQAKLFTINADYLVSCELLSAALEHLLEGALRPEITFVLLRVINQYSYSLSVEERFDEAQLVLEQGQKIYELVKESITVETPFYTADDLFAPSLEIVPREETYEYMERLVTNNSQMLGYVYNKQGKDDLFAFYQHRVLDRQLRMREGEALGWSIKAARLGNHFLTLNQFKEARTHLAAACKVLNVYEEDLMSMPLDEHVESKFEEVSVCGADIGRAWVKYGLQLMASSTHHKLEKTCGNPVGDFDDFEGEFVGDDGDEQCDDEESESNVEENEAEGGEVVGDHLVGEGEGVKDEVVQGAEVKEEDAGKGDQDVAAKYEEDKEKKDLEKDISEGGENEKDIAKENADADSLKVAENNPNDNVPENELPSSEANNIVKDNELESSENTANNEKEETVDNVEYGTEKLDESEKIHELVEEIKKRVKAINDADFSQSTDQPSDDCIFVDADPVVGLEFPCLDLSHYETAVPCDPLTSIHDAQLLFAFINGWHKRAIGHYNLHDHPLDYTECVLVMVEMLRLMTIFEDETERKYNVHKKRAEALETVCESLRSEHPEVFHEVSFNIYCELADVHMELMGLNLNRLYTSHGDQMNELNGENDDDDDEGAEEDSELDEEEVENELDLIMEGFEVHGDPADGVLMKREATVPESVVEQEPAEVLQVNVGEEEVEVGGEGMGAEEKVEVEGE